MVAHTINPSTREAEAGGSVWVRGQTGWQSQFQGSQSCHTEKHTVLKTKNQQTKQTKNPKANKQKLDLQPSQLLHLNITAY